jgi:gamma-glutamylcyclotransferase (GGCT)/AIG2-like uncharacterized protein YtfP
MSSNGDGVFQLVDEVLYFAYGSNMSKLRLEARVSVARRIAIARLPGFQLRFHKRSLVDGSAKCDAFYTGDEQDCVWGVVSSVAKAELSILDKIEGEGYDRTWLDVETSEATSIRVITYLANCIDAELLPFDWYKYHVLVGAKEAGLSPEYIARIEAVEAQVDPDQERCKKELSIYR